MHIFLEAIRAKPAYRRLLERLKTSEQVAGLGLPRAARLPVLAALHADLGQPLLLVTDRADHALTLHDELEFWMPGSPRHLFLEPASLFYEQVAWGTQTRRERLQALTALSVYHLPFAEKPAEPAVIVASARALMTCTLPRRDFLKSCKQLSKGQSTSHQSLIKNWIEIGYQPVDTVLEPGQFSHRGGILDIWPTVEQNPLRLDFFGDVIDTLRQFDPASQRTITQRNSVLVTPAREYLLSNLKGLQNWSVEEISEFHIPLLHPFPSNLFDYLPARAVVLVDDLAMLESVVNDLEEQAIKFRAELITEGNLTDDFPVPYLGWTELRENLQERACLELGHSLKVESLDLDAKTDEDDMVALFGQLPRFGGRLKQFMDYLSELAFDKNVAVIVSRQSARLKDLWAQLPASSSAVQVPQFVEASLSEGWQIDNLFCLTDSEVFGWERPQPRQRARRKAETPEAVYADLQPGDWVVHIDYGVGRFIGLVQRVLEGLEREFLCIEYRHGDQLYVPIHQADRLTRYIGPDASVPVLGHLGSQEWPETKRRVKQAIRQMALELLDLYARRQVAPGYAFGADTLWQAELEASFPYIETEDQVKVIGEVKMDMEMPRPMDRLLCGDVGYGKTEVALRSAFKAVMDGKQVAVLVPTTVLAQQHYDTFCQRLAAFPVAVEMLSRFRTRGEQEKILMGLITGAIDIVIGTHRLIQPDVTFKDLGLVIIDEEQRFGVTHKEHLKKLRTEVDVLTLTATPIPRTLYMALTGVRDVSTLNTPPEERLPVVTHIGPYSPRVVRQSILRELERGGQVFFVHNRVQTIDAMCTHLSTLVPEARIAIAHGQMPENELASVMRRFTAGEVDILLSTSIIESGLDIPNANTLIVDRADAFGLAQLYQLRGRVGRGAMRAYAYFFRHRKILPTPEGQERLEIIAENTQLGSGYSIALRDLEMRGAGELLGTRQHGHIAAVGFHLYTRLLAAAVRSIRRARGLTEEISTGLRPSLAEIGLPVNVDLPLASGIPTHYIPDQDLRLRLYRRLADLTDEASLEALEAEFVDRFGKPPEMVQNLFYQMRVKMRSERAGLVAVSFENGQIVLRYAPAAEGVKPKRLPDLEPGVRGGKNAYWCTYGKEPDWQARLLVTLAKLDKQAGMA